ncbi:hypothetical protein [Pelotomaculum propionicicum]|uniref:Uncharacterized protein n=1 Tax=Pelotomaculum propionicicum TaxID=258475 RepID=A0A4Y7RND9_9FIRM|nr:hypothetical protein [Pelotomaculum propionicicum]NLI13248.1 hypothetical protein [Peptococcaceae bacterium]TEB10514.1 hypothetical protein Pmgp_02313 [Pelotomaculum propionicicum]
MVNCPYTNKRNNNALNEISSELACEFDFICDEMHNCVNKQAGMATEEHKKKGALGSRAAD